MMFTLVQRCTHRIDDVHTCSAIHCLYDVFAIFLLYSTCTHWISDVLTVKMLHTVQVAMYSYVDYVRIVSVMYPLSKFSTHCISDIYMYPLCK